MAAIEDILEPFALPEYRDYLEKYDKELNKKECILIEATKIFIEKGFFRTKMEMIAQNAGIGKSTIYEYFSSKQDLFFQSIYFVQTEFNRELTLRLAKEKDPEKQLEITIKAYLLLGNLLTFVTEPLRNMNEIPEGIKENALEFWQKSNDLIEDILKRGIEMGKFRSLDTLITAKLLTGMCISTHVNLSSKEISISRMLVEMNLLIRQGIIK